MDVDLPDAPVPIQPGQDLQEKAKTLGITYFIPTIYSLNIGIKGPLIPAESIRTIQQNGFNIQGMFDFGYGACEPENYAVPDPLTLIQLPWKPEYGWLACNLYHKGKPSVRCPRIALMRQVARLHKLGFTMKTGIEPEFMLMKKDKFELIDEAEQAIYHDPNVVLENAPFLTKVVDCMQSLGWKPYQAEHEFLAAQYEINYTYSDALQSADRFSFFKFMVKAIARECGVRATFMPLVKPMVTGSGLHIHASLWSVPDDVTVMGGEEEDLMGLSETGRHFLGGLMTYMEPLTALACPTINSYKRLHATQNLLNIKSYGVGTRYPCIRVIQDKKVANRFEYRVPDGAVNPYLIQAAMISTAIYGIENKIEPDPSQRTEEELFFQPKPPGMKSLPKTQDFALELLENCDHLKTTLGEELVENYIKVKQFVLTEYHKQVTPVEESMCDTY